MGIDADDAEKAGAPRSPAEDIGALYLGDGRTKFTVWAPRPERVALRLLGPPERLLDMERDARGYWRAKAEAGPGTRYLYRLSGLLARPGSDEPSGVPASSRFVDRSDPASHWQPDGVPGPSAVADHAAFPWPTAWPRAARPLRNWVIYELHVGTFTPEGTFDAIIPRLDALVELGVNCLEIMPVAQFPGRRNWGYDGVHAFAPQDSYGGPEGFKRLVAACHARDLAVILDVVYNHFGPEGNHAEDFGPYLTDHHHTPWGRAVNFDAEEADGVRAFVLANVRHWLTRYRLDGLRIDAAHALVDLSARHVLAEMAALVRRLEAEQRRPLVLIAESDLNDARLVRSPAMGGYGLDGQWNDDFHHALHALLTGERTGYYAAFGQVGHLARCLEERFAFTGQWNVFRRRAYGAPALDVPSAAFVVCAQNHDQVGNRLLGERLAGLVSFEALKVAAGALLLSPFTPLMFMGEEYGEKRPFLYFVDHADDGLRAAVRRGRAEEFKSFAWAGEPPDPSAEKIFRAGVLAWEDRGHGQGQVLLALYKTLIALRGHRAFTGRDRLVRTAVMEKDKVLVVRLGDPTDGPCLLGLFAFGSAWSSIPLPGLLPPGVWSLLLDSASPAWSGPGGLLPAVLDGTVTSLTLGPERFAVWERT